MHEKNKQPNKQRTKKTTQKGGKIKIGNTLHWHLNTENEHITIKQETTQ